MRVDWTDEQEFLREAVAGVVTREAPFATVRGWTESGDPAAADELAARQGWTGIGLDEDAGGQGGATLELAVLAEQLGRGAVPWDRTLVGCLTGPLLAAAGAADLAAATAEGERVAILAFDGRVPLAAIARDDTRAAGSGERDLNLAGDARETSTLSPAVLATVAGEHLKVALRDVLGAPRAQTFVVGVAAGDAVELYAIDAGAESVTVRPRTLVDRTRSLADVEIDGEARLVGSVSSPTFAAAANAAAVLVAADALGAAARALELTTQYVSERRQFGVPVGSFQAVKHAAAEMLVDVEAARSAVMHAAWAVGAGEDEAARHASIAKAVACAGASRVADKALFLHGAVGYTWEHDLQFLFKRIKSDVQLFGSPDTHLDLLAAELL